MGIRTVIEYKHRLDAYVTVQKFAKETVMEKHWDSDHPLQLAQCNHPLFPPLLMT